MCSADVPVYFGNSRGQVLPVFLVIMLLLALNGFYILRYMMRVKKVLSTQVSLDRCIMHISERYCECEGWRRIREELGSCCSKYGLRNCRISPVRLPDEGHEKWQIVTLNAIEGLEMKKYFPRLFYNLIQLMEGGIYPGGGRPGKFSAGAMIREGSGRCHYALVK